MGANNFFVTFKWMNDIKLNNSERDLYAVIYGFSQGESGFMGSQSYLAEMTGLSRRTVIRCLKVLEDKGLVEKETYFNGKTACYTYFACIPAGCDNLSQGGVTICHRGCDNLSHNNIDDNIDDNNSLSNKHTSTKEKQTYGTYGTYGNVKLTADEYDKWQGECPKADEYIESLSGYIAMKGAKYKNHLAVLRTWYRNDKAKEPAAVKQKKESSPSYNIEQFKRDSLADNLVYTPKRKD